MLIKAQVSALDEAVANITAAVEEELGTRWLMVFVGDNGGQTYSGHSNAPLRGGVSVHAIRQLLVAYTQDTPALDWSSLRGFL